MRFGAPSPESRHLNPSVILTKVRTQGAKRCPSWLWVLTFVRMTERDYPISRPASAADIRFAKLPAASARRPSLAIIGRWFGARLPVTAI